MALPDFRTVSYSQTTITELMIPAYANFGGKIHGGTVLSIMDKVAYACAAKHAGGYCVTVAVETVNFRSAIEVGELVHFMASVNYVGNSSMVVGIRVVAEDVTKDAVRHTNTSYFTMVAKSEEGKPRQVPGLKLESKEQVLRYLEAIKRIEIRNRYAGEFDDARTQMNLDNDIVKLEGRRCIVEEGIL